MTDFSSSLPNNSGPSMPNNVPPVEPKPWEPAKIPVPSQQANSYVNDYMPPSITPPASVPSSFQPPKSIEPTPAAPSMPPALTPSSMPSLPPVPPMPSYQPPEPFKAPEVVKPPEPVKPVEATPTSSPTPSSSSETLEDQNIFHLLGVEEATESEKEAFLDELQQVIWEDFLENDVELLLTEEELVEFKKIADKQMADQEAHQTEMVEYLEKLIPDLEKIMLEKALELKEDMIRERITQLTEQYKESPEKLAKVTESSHLVEEQKWRSAANVLNAIPA